MKNGHLKLLSSSVEAIDYQRISRIDNFLRKVGGIGGSSLRLPHGMESYSRSIPLKDLKRCELILYEKIGSGGFGSGLMKTSLFSFF